MLVKRIKVLLGITENDELLHEIVSLTQAKILYKIKENEIPKELEFILIEACIERYNRIGSEGISSESIEGKSVTYEVDISAYEQDIQDYISSKNNTKKGYKLL